MTHIWPRFGSMTLALALGLATVPALAADRVATPAADIAVKASVEQIAAIMRADKFPVEIKVDNEGLPFIQSERDERPFRVYLYDCDDGVRMGECLSIQFVGAFTLKRPFPPERMNEWNRKYRFGRGYVDTDLDPVIEMDVNMAQGGVSAAWFKDTFGLWLDIFQMFDEFVFATPDPDKPDSGKNTKAPETAMKE
ncbi:YbjN domain-containing protein [Sphingopyxis sp. H050]|uniref:YbjN domain-containing protein n=1 Tax=Sphingopyxis sp. H050 TaxID=1759072 RepID=UPI0018D254F8|nr:YbjN domain-containing protein [Sphingopyxis sp. H050]